MMTSGFVMVGDWISNGDETRKKRELIDFLDVDSSFPSLIR